MTCQQLRELVPHVRILMLTNDASQRTAAAPYVLNKSASEIVQTMKTLAVRETYFADLLA